MRCEYCGDKIPAANHQPVCFTCATEDPERLMNNNYYFITRGIKPCLNHEPLDELSQRYYDIISREEM